MLAFLILEKFLKLYKVPDQIKQEKAQIIQRFWKKDLFHLKADDYLRLLLNEDNKVVILEKTDYYERSNTLINNGPYIKITKNPLLKLISELRVIFCKWNKVVTPVWK